MLTAEQQQTLLFNEEMGSVRAESELRKEVEELRREVSNIRVRAENSAPREALLEERSSRELGEGAVRQIAAKLEESLARETVALRADNADLRASLTEALKLLADERKERQSDVLDASRKIKDFQAWSEEKTQRLEALARQADARANETKQGMMEVERLRDLTEFRAIAAVAEEGRNRDSAMQSEQQAREGLVAEAEARIRVTLNEEKQSRNKALDELTQMMRRLEETVMENRKQQTQHNTESVARIEETLRGVYEEGRRRQADILNLSAQVEDMRMIIKSEANERSDADATNYKRIQAVESGLEQHMDRSEMELSNLRQGLAELRAACQVEATVREESVARLHGFLDEEARAREEAQAVEASQREQVGQRLDQHWRVVMSEQRQQREDGTSEMETKFANLQHEHNFEKAKAAAQARELAQAVAQAREAIGAETAARRHEVNLMVRGLDEVRENMAETSTMREKTETRFQEQLSCIDKALREECSAREVIERKTQGECTELQDGMQRLARAQRELEISVETGINEERRLREEREDQQVRSREEGDSRLSMVIQELMQEEAQNRDKEVRLLERRLATAEQARTGDVADREEEKRTLKVRLDTMSDGLTEARGEMRKALQKCDDFDTLRETLLSESASRQAEERGLEMSVKEQQVKLEQLQRSREQVERRIENKLADMTERMETEAGARGASDMKYAKQMSDFAAEYTALQQAELRRLEEVVAKAEKSLLEKTFEERGLREKAFSIVEAKTLELREGVDEVRKWRVEQYNELVFELAKLTEMLTEEAKARQQQDQVLAGEVTRLREETSEEATARKYGVASMQEEFKDVLTRLERERKGVEEKERERWRAIEAVRDDCQAESVKREAADSELRQLLDKEVLNREEIISGTTRAWQKANTKTNEDWRAAVRNDTVLREEGQLRLEQQLVEVRTAVQESRSLAEQSEDEIRQRFKVAAEALQMEEVSRKTEDLLIQKALEELRGVLTAEQGERASSEQHTADRFGLMENQLRDEALLREDGERRAAKDVLEMQVRLQQEQVAREESDIRLEQRCNAEAEAREELFAREARQREEGDAIGADAWQRSLREEQGLRERDRKDLVSRLQQAQQQQQDEHEERVRVNRDVTAQLARLQSLGKEEEESRIELGERLGAAIESINDAVRVLGPQREDILKKCMDAVDQVRNLVNKEVVARTTKSEALDDALRDVRQRLNDEVQSRESGIRAVEEAVMEERTMREDALVRERRSAEEELQKALQATRKLREEENRKMQERILEVSSAVQEERDLRQEALRQERQKLLDTKEALSRDQKTMEREVSKMSQQALRQTEGDTQRAKEIDMMLGSVLDKCESVRSDFTGEVSRRQGQLQVLEQRLLEMQNLLSAEVKERREMGEDLKKAVDEEAATRDSVLTTDRRAREAGDLQVASALKVVIRDEREARESEGSLLAKELNALKGGLSEEIGHREEDRSQQSLAVQKLRTEIQELLGERKVDVVAMREAFSQVTEELKVVQRTRKEDVDRIDGSLSALSNRVDSNARTSRDQCVTLEQSINVMQSDLQVEVDERQANVAKLDSRISDEKRMLEANFAAGLRANEDSIQLQDEAGKARQAEDVRKQKALLDQLELQIGNLSGDLEKSRNLGTEQARELARGIAALQGALSAEEQARQQSGWQLQQGVDSVREEIAAEAKERRGQAALVVEEVQNNQRLFQQRDERVDASVQKLSVETSDLRDRLGRELRQREAAVAQVEQRLLSFQGVKDGAPNLAQLSTPEKAPAPSQAPEGPAGAQWREFQRQTDEDLQKQKRQLDSLMLEQQSMAKSMGTMSEKVETLRTGLTQVQTTASEVQTKHRQIGDIELQVRVSREDLAKEAKERRAEFERMSRMQSEIVDRLETAEQKKLVNDNDVQQDLLDTKNALKKETRDRELAASKIASSVREETQKREEAVEREERARQEAQQRSTDSFAAALREERRAREKDVLRFESGRPVSAVGKPGMSNDAGPPSNEVATLQLETRSVRNALGDLQERLSQAEMRQKSAEERTVSMLDTIMSGLATGD